MSEKAMTLRLSSWQHVALKCMAQASGRSISDEVREAIDNHIKARQEDPEFQRRIHRQIEANQEILERFASGSGGSDGE